MANQVILAAALVYGVVVGIRATTSGKVAAWLCVAGCTILLCVRLGTLTLNFFGLVTSFQLMQVLNWIIPNVDLVGMLTLIASMTSALRDNAAANEAVKRPPWSRGRRLLASAVFSLAILPINVGMVLAMVRTSWLIPPTIVAGLFAVPGIVTWLLASRYLEALRLETPPSGQRPITLWAYGIASLSSLGAIFCALFAFILLGLQQGWINPQ